MWTRGLCGGEAVFTVYIISLGSTRLISLTTDVLKKVLDSERSFVFPLGGAQLEIGRAHV